MGVFSNPSITSHNLYYVKEGSEVRGTFSHVHWEAKIYRTLDITDLSH